jgi:N-acetylmuramoyl-L-alanine amidase
MGGSESARLESIKLSQAYSQATGVPVWNGGAFDDRNGRFGRIGMVRDTTPFALLIEAGFVTNRQDMSTDPRVAAAGIAKYYENSGF